MGDGVPSTRPPVHHRWRWTAAIVLIVITAILIPESLVARYARGQLLNTDRYVAMVTPLADDPAVQTALTDRVTTEIIDRVDVPALVQQLTGALSFKGAAALGNLVSGPINDWLTSFVRTHVQQFVSSPQFRTLWTTVNRLAHRNVNAVLTGDQSRALGQVGDAVVLNIGPIVDAVKSALVADGFSLASRVPSTDVQFTLFQSDQLTKIQGYVRLLNRLATWLPWIILACFVLAIWAAPDRRRAALVGLVTAVVLLVLMRIGIQLTRHAYIDQLASNGRSVPAGTAVFDNVVHFLIIAIWTTLFGCLAVAVWAWLAGPGRAGLAVRRFLGRGSGAAARGLGWTRSGFLGLLDRFRPWIYAVLGLVAFVVLLRSPTVVTVAWLLLVALVLSMAFAIIHRLRMPAPVTAA